MIITARGSYRGAQRDVDRLVNTTLINSDEHREQIQRYSADRAKVDMVLAMTATARFGREVVREHRLMRLRPKLTVDVAWS